MANQNEVYEKVKTCMVEALGVDEEEIKPEARIMDDLGAESIDFLDIVFRLEKAFGIKIPRGGLFPDNILANSTFVKDGKVTAQGLEELRKRMPYANLAAFEKDPRVSNFSSLFTVDLINRYVANVLK
ncbi:MAG: acyl carrier protein [Candidatus Aureabacteria bacterium]|nr:acyl carrier protein [Candidatus Auribacterota bacterium]